MSNQILQKRTSSGQRQKQTEPIYQAIQARSGNITMQELQRQFGSRKARYSITRLTIAGKIKRIRKIGDNGIEYHYKTI